MKIKHYLVILSCQSSYKGSASPYKSTNFSLRAPMSSVFPGHRPNLIFVVLVSLSSMLPWYAEKYFAFILQIMIKCSDELSQVVETEIQNETSNRTLPSHHLKYHRHYKLLPSNHVPHHCIRYRQLGFLSARGRSLEDGAMAGMPGYGWNGILYHRCFRR